MKTIAIYHKNCNDGTTAAAVVLRKYPDALVFPLSHGFDAEDFDPIMAAATPGDRILTVDCVLGVKEFLAKGFKVTSIDHHASAQAEFAAIAAANPDFTFVFDNSHSGAALTWLTLFPNEPMPEAVKLVEDQDLWKNLYGDESRHFNNVVFMLANKPEEMKRLLDGSIDAQKREGAAISRYAEIMMESMADTEPITLRVGHHEVPLFNVNSYKSDMGNRFTLALDKAVGLFTIDGEKVKISFRCLDRHSPSASDLAVTFGGGGHHNAAGCAMPLDTFLKSIVRP